MTERILVGDLVAEFLQAVGVRTAFGVISVHNIPMLDAIGRRNAIRFVMSRGEAGGGHMADAYARVSDGLGVVFTSTGPGAANVTATLSAHGVKLWWPNGFGEQPLRNAQRSKKLFFEHHSDTGGLTSGHS